MNIERTDNEILIRIPATTDLTGVQRLIDYLGFKETASKSQATQEQIDKLAREAKSEWWDKNKARFIK